MEKRLKFECWHCQKTYSLLRKIEEGWPLLWVACPFCGKEAIVDLAPHSKNVDKVYRNDLQQNVTEDQTLYDLPDILPTLTTQQEIGDKSDEGTNFKNISSLYQAQGDFKTALANRKQLLSIENEIGGRPGEGTRVGNLGIIYHNSGQFQEAIEYYEQALSIAFKVGDKHNAGTWLGNLGKAYAALEKIEQAIEYYQKGLAVAREIGDRRKESNYLNNLGNGYLSQKNYEQAVEYYEQVVIIKRALGDQSQEIAEIITNIAFCLDSLGRTNEAITKLEQVIKDYKKSSTLEKLAKATYSLGRLNTKILNFEKARILLKDALRYYKHIHHHLGIANSQELLAQLAIRTRGVMGIEEALERYQDASNNYYSYGAFDDHKRIIDLVERLQTSGK